MTAQPHLAPSRVHCHRAAVAGVLVAVVGAAGAVAAARRLVTTWTMAACAPSPAAADAATLVLWAALAAALAWAAVVAALASCRLVRRPGAATPGPAWPQSCSVRRAAMLLLALTAALGGGAARAVAAPAAVVVQQPSPGSPATTLWPTPDFTAPADDAAAPPMPGWTPSAPPAAQRAADSSPLVTGSSSTGDPSITVRRGDSLWSLVARHLGPDADAAEVAHTWPAWFDANRDVIGDDPDLLMPGQVLRVPDAAVVTR